jgi:hypothetical protein
MEKRRIYLTIDTRIKPFIKYQYKEKRICNKAKNIAEKKIIKLKYEKIRLYLRL